jgi:hypothetical protein
MDVNLGETSDRTEHLDTDEMGVERETLEVVSRSQELISTDDVVGPIPWETVLGASQNPCTRVLHTLSMAFCNVPSLHYSSPKKILCQEGEGPTEDEEGET